MSNSVSGVLAKALTIPPWILIRLQDQMCNVAPRAISNRDVPAMSFSRYKIARTALRKEKSAIIRRVIIIIAVGAASHSSISTAVAHDLHEAERNNQNFTNVFEETCFDQSAKSTRRSFTCGGSIRNTGEKRRSYTIVDTTDVLSETSFKAVQSSTPTASSRLETPSTQSSTPIHVAKTAEHFKVHLTALKTSFSSSKPARRSCQRPMSGNSFTPKAHRSER